MEEKNSFMQMTDELIKQGLSKKEIAMKFNLTVGEYIALRKIYKNRSEAETN